MFRVVQATSAHSCDLLHTALALEQGGSDAAEGEGGPAARLPLSLNTGILALETLIP